MIGVKVTHVPYRGVAPMLTDVMSGQIGLGFAGFVPQILNMKALAVTAATRVKILPDVPTVREALRTSCEAHEARLAKRFRTTRYTSTKTSDNSLLGRND